ncbi:MAG: hypothetical protein F4029_00950 [Gammaproteobacteria bacterium]|nr:hypothetical protein [Gammaproteobacteria bacterium]
MIGQAWSSRLDAMNVNEPTRQRADRLCRLAVAALAIAGCGPDPATQNDAGAARMGRYEYAEAERLFAQAVDDAPDWLDARVNLAIATLNRQQEGDEQRTLDILADVLADDPDHLRAVYTTAIVRLYLGDAASAAAGFERVAALDPQDAYAAYFLGQSFLQQGNYADAARWFLRSIELDAYLRSAYWAGSQALRRTGRNEDAERLFGDYQRLESNPASRLAGFSYKEMGPKAAVLAAAPAPIAPVDDPEGPLFGAPKTVASYAAATITVADVDGDGRLDLVLTGGNGPTVLEGVGDGYRPSATQPFAGAGAVRSILWGDLDDDGLLDAVMCTPDGPTPWRQHPENAWSPNPDLGAAPCAAGALVDADNDGDLDVLTTGRAGTELYNNNRDGTFKALGADLGFDDGHGRQVLAVDLDNDRDLDIAILNRLPPHAVWQNDRTWRYQPFPGLEDFRETSLEAVTAADTDGDGNRELYGVTSQGDVLRWSFDGVAWSSGEALVRGAQNSDTASLDIADFDGDGDLELVRASNDGIAIIDPSNGAIVFAHTASGLTSARVVNADAKAGPVLVAASTEGTTLLPAGPGRHRFVFVSPQGRSEAEQMRSNASGIGTLVKLRHGGRWTIQDAIDPHSGPGQSLQPMSFGIGRQAMADFVALEWSDGVSQTELDLCAGRVYDIAEVQRQLASCPVLFAWNGSAFEFVSDMLGGAALGYLEAPGKYAPPRPHERFLLGPDALKARDGRYQIKLAEPMEEAAYLDAAALTVYDLPPGWHMVLDERLAVAGAPATGRPIFFRRAASPSRVTDAQGDDVTTLAIDKDQRAPPPGELDHRFIGLLAAEQVLTLEFPMPLPREGAVLIADAWIEYPYSQTSFAAWQAGLRYRPVTLEARANGSWHTVAREFGYPAGMPRTMALPLPDLPNGTDALRLSSNMEIYWDRLRVAFEEPLDANTAVLTPVVARIARSGFARRSTAGQRLPHYDYADRPPYWDAKTPRGFYTAFGEASELVNRLDGALAIIGSGEEVHLEFAALAPPPPDHARVFAIEFHGWAKDMDLYTRDGNTLDPLPASAGLHGAPPVRRDELHDRYNVRFRGGPLGSLSALDAYPRVAGGRVPESAP